MLTSTRRPGSAVLLSALLVPLCLLSLACPDETPTPIDPPLAGEDPTAVHGKRIIHRRLETGDVSTADTTEVRSTLEVLVPTGDTFETRPAISVDTDTFKFANVPEGPYYLKRGTSAYVITSHRQLNLDEHLLGREGVVTVPAAIPVTLSVDGLAPMDAYQELDMVAPNAGAAGVLHMDTPPQPGATSLSAAGATYRSAFGRQEVVDATKGDRLYLLQKLRRSAGDFNYFATARGLTLTRVSFRPDEQATPMDGTFAALPPRPLTLDWRRSSFEAHRASVHPLAVSLPETSVRHSFILAPAVGGISEGVVGYAGELLSGNIPAASQDVTLALEYGNPYPPTWGVVASVVHRYQVPVRLPAQGAMGTIGVSLEDQAELSAFSSQPVQARLSPPSRLQVDGADAQADRTLASLTPVFTWEPPTLGTADVYELRIFRLYTTTSAPDVARAETVATFLTARRQVRVPPGVLQAKQSYVVRIAALRTPGVDLTRAPYRMDSLVDTSLAEALTSVLTTP
ncbi:hypothetical protein [Hyalangium gracile]|uniref:hypothetical protein n=1 Tax=Hyalangium gracile TaxID=394092 RepID=UPI001CCFB68A|nr:hypothetical protein [Hyalangium gracile]